MITHHLEFANAWLLFIALFALYSPVAALSSYLPYVEGYSKAVQRRLALGLFFNVLIMSMTALWVGEPLLELLGISTAALSATGGIALLLAAVPMMTGSTEAPDPPALDPAAAGVAKERPAWRSIVFTPLTFPLTFGGTTFGFFVSTGPSPTAVPGRSACRWPRWRMRPSPVSRSTPPAIWAAGSHRT